MPWAGYAHTLFVTVNKRLFAAGHNDYGELGFEPTHAPSCQYTDAPDLTCRYNPTPNAVPTEVDPHRFNRSVVLARAGRHFSVKSATCLRYSSGSTDGAYARRYQMVVTEDGRLWSLGLNTYGQLGTMRLIALGLRQTVAGTEVGCAGARAA